MAWAGLSQEILAGSRHSMMIATNPGDTADALGRAWAPLGCLKRRGGFGRNEHGTLAARQGREEKDWIEQKNLRQI